MKCHSLEVTRKKFMINVVANRVVLVVFIDDVNQARIQHLKEVSQTDKIAVFPFFLKF